MHQDGSTAHQHHPNPPDASSPFRAGSGLKSLHQDLGDIFRTPSIASATGVVPKEPPPIYDREAETQATSDSLPSVALLLREPGTSDHPTVCLDFNSFVVTHRQVNPITDTLRVQQISLRSSPQPIHLLCHFPLNICLFSLVMSS
ncbi:unnamed protein product [Somion occarium]|uniref:Uncharacterized protein n=1 Tax=Somion occarium TaxID=3059160 RepID=A0ABP1CJB7_9APHY